MKRTNTFKWMIGALFCSLGVAGNFMTKDAALSDGAQALQTVPFALSLICLVVGMLLIITIFLPRRKAADVRTLTLAAMFAALCYIGFTYCKIDIPVGAEKTAFHLGNVFCVLAALFLGGFWGGMSGAVGMTIADLTTAYVTSAPKTFILKLGIGLVTGFVAHKVFHISTDTRTKLSLPAATVISCAAGMLFNIVADPLVGYFYKMYVLGVPQNAAAIWVKIGAVTTTVNAVVAVVAASVFYLALRPALQRSGTLPKVH